jgi:hypothetical protein
MHAPPDPETQRAALAGSPVAKINEKHSESTEAPQRFQARKSILSPEEQELAAQARKAFYNKPRTNECCKCAVDAAEEVAFLRADDLVTQWELADPRDRWRHTGEPPPPPEEEILVLRPYRTAQSTIDAFRYVVREGDPEYLEAWLGRHPKDAPYLRGLLGGKK